MITNETFVSFQEFGVDYELAWTMSRDPSSNAMPTAKEGIKDMPSPSLEYHRPQVKGNEALLLMDTEADQASRPINTQIIITHPTMLDILNNGKDKDLCRDRDILRHIRM